MATVLIYWFVLLAAASTALATASTSTLLAVCETNYGPTSTSRVSTEDEYLTVTGHATLTTTSTPIKTSVLPPSTITSMVTDTVYSTSVLDQSTLTFSTTLTSTTVITSYDTITYTALIMTITTATYTPTTTIPPSSGFTFASALSQSTQGPRQTAAAEQGAVTLNASIHPSQAGALVGVNPPLYPTAVICIGVVNVITTDTITRTAATTLTVTSTPPAETTIVTTESTSTVTSTPVAASTTLTFSTSTIVSTTLPTTTVTTETITNTYTLVAPEATYYAACGPDNQISEINGQPIGGVTLNGGTPTISNQTSAYDCCVECLTTEATCAGYDFSNFCILNIPSDTTCDPSRNNYETATLSNGTAAITIGNSNCGSYSLA